MAVTLKTIAEQAGVSISTVSRVINNDTIKPASAETTDRVWKIIHELQYVPNQTARRLISKVEDDTWMPRKSISCIVAASNDMHSDPFFSEVIAGIQMETAARGYVMEYTMSISRDATTNSAVFNNITTRKTDGAILLGRLEKNVFEMLTSNIPNLVYCGLNYMPADITQVLCDVRDAFPVIVDHLAALGHTRIGYIGSVNADGKLMNEWRCDAFMEGMKRNRLSVNVKDLHESELSPHGGYKAMRDILVSGDYATAYCCSNDVTAIGGLKAIYEHGLSVPHDIAMVGFGDIDMCNFVTPDITTVHVYKKEMGVQAVQTLINCIEGKVNLPIQINMPYELICRSSTRLQGNSIEDLRIPVSMKR